MIFKHEYLVTEDERKVYDLQRLHEKRRETCAYELGKKMIEVLEWQQIDQSKYLDSSTERYKLEIIAFPMDKWVEFKQNLLEHFCVYPGSTQKMLGFIKELESFSKQSGDTITNQQLNK